MRLISGRMVEVTCLQLHMLFEFHEAVKMVVFCVESPRAKR